MSSGRPVDDALSKNHIDQAVKDLAASVRIDATHWVPYLAGYSKDWTNSPTVYIDARMPDTLKVGGKIMQPYRYLIIHECVEKSLMDQLGLSYAISHDFATSAEKSAVEADGFNWAAYTDAINPFIREAMKQPQGLEIPPDLDLAPYEQDHAHVTPELEQEEARSTAG